MFRMKFTKWTQQTKNAIHLLPGLQKLNGEEALALARTRKYDNDIERGKRQQEIIKAIVEKAISVNSFTKYDDIIETVGDNMKTNLTTGQIAGLIKYSLGEKDLDIDTHTLIGYDYQPGSTYYYKLDEIELENTKELLQNHLGINIQTTPYTAEEPDFEPGLEEETANVIKYNH